MASLTEWTVPQAAQPRTDDYDFDLEQALAAVVGLHSIIPPDAFTAEVLGTERVGNGVVIDLDVLFGEIEALSSRGVDFQHPLISASAHIIASYHQVIDKVTERFLGKNRIAWQGLMTVAHAVTMPGRILAVFSIRK